MIFSVGLGGILTDIMIQLLQCVSQKICRQNKIAGNAV
jgi:hypothetical protein